MSPYAEGLVGPSSPWEAFTFWLSDMIRGSLGLPPIMRIM